MTTLSTSVAWRRIDGGRALPELGELVWWARRSSLYHRTKDMGWVPAVWLGLTEGDHAPMNMATTLMDGKINSFCHLSRFHRGHVPPTRRRQ